MDFLALYGQEYPDSFYSDTTRAVLYLGEMAATTCLLQAEAAGSDWRMMTIEDLPYFLDLAVNALSVDDANGNFWLYNGLTKSMFFIEYHTQSPDSNWDPVFNADGSASWKFEYPRETNYYHTKRHCLLVSEVRPEYEYSSCSEAGGPSGYFETCIESKLHEGWIPMQGVNHNWYSQYQGFWRIKD
jgi:hypothetical protein